MLRTMRELPLLASPPFDCMIWSRFSVAMLSFDRYKGMRTIILPSNLLAENILLSFVKRVTSPHSSPSARHCSQDRAGRCIGGRREEGLGRGLCWWFATICGRKLGEHSLLGRRGGAEREAESPQEERRVQRVRFHSVCRSGDCREGMCGSEGGEILFAIFFTVLVNTTSLKYMHVGALQTAKISRGAPGILAAVLSCVEHLLSRVHEVPGKGLP